MKMKMLEQKIMGVVLLLVCIVLVAMCWGAPVGTEDAGAVVLLAPLALYMLFGKKCIIL